MPEPFTALIGMVKGADHRVQAAAIALVIAVAPTAFAIYRANGVRAEQIAALQKTVADFVAGQSQRDNRQDDDRKIIERELNDKLDKLLLMVGRGR